MDLGGCAGPVQRPGLSLIDLAAHRRGAIVAPAGCGKTHAIVQCLLGHSGTPLLVLTHTNAGVAALRARFAKEGVSPKAVRLSTIDGWALRLVRMLPLRAGLAVPLEEAFNYPAIRAAAANVLEGGVLDELLSRTYAGVLVDEYQDCCVDQHRIVCALADRLASCVLGDPLQSIFGFDSEIPDWESVVLKAFPMVGELRDPERWKRAGQEKFGRWLLECREALVRGQALDLRTGPSANVTWCELPADRDQAASLKRDALKRIVGVRGDALVIGESAASATRHKLARSTGGLCVIEDVELKDLITAARDYDSRTKCPENWVIEFAADVMTGVERTVLTRRIATLSAGRERAEATPLESDLLAAAEGVGPASKALRTMAATPGNRVFRPHLLFAMLDAARLAAADACSLTSAACRVRDQRRVLGRPLPPRAVGSTLLLKGLEADHALIMNGDAMNSRELYVALTRARHSVAVISRSPELPVRATS